MHGLARQVVPRRPGGPKRYQLGAHVVSLSMQHPPRCRLSHMWLLYSCTAKRTAQCVRGAEEALPSSACMLSYGHASMHGRAHLARRGDDDGDGQVDVVRVDQAHRDAGEACKGRVNCVVLRGDSTAQATDGTGVSHQRSACERCWGAWRMPAAGLKLSAGLDWVWVSAVRTARILQ